MIHPSSFVSESVYALRDFIDNDSQRIGKGAHLGELHRAGRADGGHHWWTQRDGFVTAVFSGDASNFVTPRRAKETTS